MVGSSVSNWEWRQPVSYMPSGDRSWKLFLQGAILSGLSRTLTPCRTFVQGQVRPHRPSPAVVTTASWSRWCRFLLQLEKNESKRLQSDFSEVTSRSRSPIQCPFPNTADCLAGHTLGQLTKQLHERWRHHRASGMMYLLLMTTTVRTVMMMSCLGLFPSRILKMAWKSLWKLEKYVSNWTWLLILLFNKKCHIKQTI